MALRFLVLFIVSLLLLSPLLSTNHRDVQKPKVIVLRDNSGSVITAKNKEFYEKQFPEKLKQLEEKLGEKYEVKAFGFADATGEDAQADYSGKVTDIAQAFQYVKDIFSNQNVGAVVLASDGIYNQGNNPVYLAKELSVPVFSIGLGDTTRKKDLLISGVSHNKYAYLGNNFPVEINLEAVLCSGANTVARVADEAGNIVFSQQINIAGNRFQKVIPVMLLAKKPGLVKYSIMLETVAGEFTKANNSADIFIEVLDGRQKVLLLYSAPHPDVATIKNAISRNENYDIEVSPANDFKKNTSAYNLVILHNIPSTSGAGQTVVQELLKNDVPLLYVLGSNTAFANFNQLNAGLNINAKSNSVNESQPSANKNFTLFTLSPEVLSQVEKFPPLLSPFADYKTSPVAQSLFYQKIGSVSTEQPLILFSQQENRKIGIVVGENIWKWRLTDYYQNDSHKHFDELMSKIVQYLAVKQDKSQFRIITKNKFLENEPVLFEGEVYNDSYELVNAADVSLVVSNSKGKKYNFVFGKTSNAYRLDAGLFTPGNYSYQATCKTGDKVLTASGKFLVSEIKLEYINTTANHQLLRTLSSTTKGKFYLPADMDKIADELLQNETLKPIIYNYATFDEAIHLKWIFFLLIGLVAAEWFLRKWSGGY